MKYNKQLDGLRCIAIFFVLLQHFWWMYLENRSFGFYGVDLFFAISGFLITSILLKTDSSFKTAYGKFLGRRTLRIFPIYYLLIFVLWGIGNETVYNYKLYFLTYTYNYFAASHDLPGNELSPFWSLCVEEQFYLIWPFIVLLLRERQKVLKLIIGSVVSVCALQYLFNIFPAAVQYHYVGLFPRALTLCVGAFGAIIYKENRLPLKLLESKIAEAVVFLLLVVCINIPHYYNYLITPALWLYLIFKTYHKGFFFKPVNAFLKAKWVVYIGTISYGIYIYHKVARLYFEKYVFDPYFWKIPFSKLGILGKIQYNVNLLYLPLYTLLAIVVASISYKFIEKPILSLKDKWFGYEKQRGRKQEPKMRTKVELLQN